MRRHFYHLLTTLSRACRLWVFKLFAWFVATGYFLLQPARVMIGVRFYRALFPGRSWGHALACTWGQYHHFTTVFLDRFRLQTMGDVTFTAEGWEHLEAALSRKKGGVLLMSHLGNWEVAAHLLKQKCPESQLLLYMGTKRKEQIEALQKESLNRSGVRIVAADQNAAAPFNLLEGMTALRKGGIVSMTADRRWDPRQRTLQVRFLDHAVDLPEAPYRLALLTGAPVYVFFAFRTGERTYHFTLSPPIAVTAASRAERPAAVQKAAQAYADRLAAILRRHPLEWYHFEQFLGPKLPTQGSDGATGGAQEPPK